MKIVWKIFRSNLRNCMLCFLSAVLVSTVLCLFEGIKEMISGMEGAGTSLEMAARMYLAVLFFVGIIFTLYTVSNYSRIRIRDYGMFRIFGAGKWRVVRMIVWEYGWIYLLSYAVGVVGGMGLLLLIKAIFAAEGIAVSWGYHIAGKVILRTLFYVALIFFVAIMLNIGTMQRNSLAALLNYVETQKKLPSLRLCIPGAVAGCIGLAGALAIFGTPPLTLRKMQYGMVFLLVGLYLCFTCMGRVLLVWLEKRRWYSTHLLQMKNLYYRFAEMKNVILVVFMINFLVLVFVNVNVVEYGNTSSQYMWKYPFAYVWMTDAENAARIEQETHGAAGETEVYPYLHLTGNDGGDYLGISVSTYNQLTGAAEHLQTAEVIAILQKAKDDSEMMFRENKVFLKSGQAYEPFQIKKEGKEILFVAQQPEMIRVLVVSDESYAALEQKENTKKVVITQTTGRGTQKEETRIKKLAAQCGAVLYAREELMRQDRKEDIMTLIFYVCMGIFLVISNVTILAIKTWTEIPVLSSKYVFLGTLGMDREEIRRNVKAELSVYFQIPLVLSAVIGTLILFYLLRDAEKSLAFRVAELFGGFLLLQLFYIKGIRVYGYRLVADGIGKKAGA